MLDSLFTGKPKKSLIVDWYDGVIKVLVYLPNENGWFYCYMIALDVVSKTHIYGVKSLSADTLKELSNCLGEDVEHKESLSDVVEEQYENMCVVLSESIAKEGRSYLVSTKSILDGCDGCIEIDYSPDEVNVDELYNLESSKLESWKLIFNREKQGFKKPS